MYQRILVPLDGSPTAEQVVPLARALAVHLDSSVFLLRAIGPIRPAGNQTEWLRRQAREYLEAMCQDFSGHGIAVQADVLDGEPAAAILRFAETEKIELIAMTTHSRTGSQRWAYGKVAERVLATTDVPILLTRARETFPPPAAFTRILIPLDGSTLGESALGPAQQLGAAFKAELILFRVQETFPYGIEDPLEVLNELERRTRMIAEHYLADVKSRMEAQGARVQTQTRSGPVANAILQAAQISGADLIVMSVRKRSVLRRWFKGSAVNRLLGAAPIPVLLIQSPRTRGMKNSHMEHHGHIALAPSHH